jgi:hypothetical protein
MIQHTRTAETRRRAFAACAALALVALAVSVVRGGACTTGSGADGEAPLRRSERLAPEITRADGAALEAASSTADAATLAGVTAPPMRVAVPSDESHAHLARLDIVVRAEGRSVAGAIVELQGIGAVFPAPGTTLDDEDRPVTDHNGLASVFVRPMVTWHGAVSTQHPRWVGEFEATAPLAGDTCTLEVVLEPSIDARCVHLVVVSLPSGAPLGGVALRCETRGGAVRRSTDGSTKGVTGVDGRVVLCWPEDATLRIEAKEHTLRRLTWDDAQRPVEQLAHTSMAAAGASDPIEVELATLGALYGDSMPAWAVAGHVDLVTLQQRRPSAFERVHFSVRLDGRGNWRFDGVPTWVGRESSRAFGADMDVPTFEIVWSQTPGRRSTQWHTAPLAEDVTLLPGEARRISAPWPDEVVELDAVVTIDGVLASAGVQVTLVRRPTPSGPYEALVVPEQSSGRSREAERLVLERRMRRFGEYRVALTVESDGHVRVPALQPGTYDVTSFLSERAELVDQGLESAAFVRPLAAAVLVLPGGARSSRFTGELALRRNN